MSKKTFKYRALCMVILMMIFNTASFRTMAEEICKASSRLDIEKLKAADQYLRSKRDNHTHSFTVHHCGEKVFERFYRVNQASPGGGRLVTGHDVHELQSATKTLSAIMIGIAMKRGNLPDDVHTPIKLLLPERYEQLFVNGREKITLYHLLTMSSGIKWVDPQDGGDSFEKLESANDSVSFLLSEPLVDDPGTRFHYNTGNSHLLSAIVYYNTPEGVSQKEYVSNTLLNILDIQIDWMKNDDELPTQPPQPENYWLTSRDGILKGGWDSYFRIEDFYKFGLLLSNGGSWQGTQILDSRFVEAMTSNHTDLNPGYGYQMWIPKYSASQAVASQSGYGGQENIIIEGKQVLVTFTGDIRPFPMEAPYNDTDGAWMRQIRDISKVMRDFVIPALGGLTHPETLRKDSGS